MVVIMTEMKQLIEAHPTIAILRDVEDAVLKEYGRSLYEGGIRSFEISCSNINALAQIERLRTYLPDDIFLGAGTVITPELAKQAVAAGAQFLLSPSSDEAVLDYCAQEQIPLLPGVFSPSDVSLCLRYGFHTLKLFPAASLPVNYIESLKGPFPDTHYVAVGGVSLTNVNSYLEKGFIGAGIGGSLVNKKDLEMENWHAISVQIHQSLNSLRQKRQSSLV